MPAFLRESVHCFNLAFDRVAPAQSHWNRDSTRFFYPSKWRIYTAANISCWQPHLLVSPENVRLSEDAKTRVALLNLYHLQKLQISAGIDHTMRLRWRA